jgi:hydroxyacylglutathione hydrolase
MRIYRLPVLRDNYIFVLYDAQRKVAAVVDPAEAEPVLHCLETLNAELVAILNTHHHHDHVGGNVALLREFSQAVVYGGAEDRGRLPGQTVFLQEGDRVKFGDRAAEVLFVPGHTRAHIAYYFPAEAQVTPEAEISRPQQSLEEWEGITSEGTPELFCGDTLFAGGCGRLFEGTPRQMIDSLAKLRNLPENTRVWCAHEYTLNNLRFALHVDPANPDLRSRIAAVAAAREHLVPTIPSDIGLEKRTNPFLRWDQFQLQQAVKSNDPIQTFARLRGMKDQF